MMLVRLLDFDLNKALNLHG